MIAQPRFPPAAVLLVAGLVVGLAMPAVAATLDIAFQGLKRDDGTIVVALYDSPASWRGKERAARRLVVPAAAGRARIVDLAPGAYAIKAFHDLDGDGRLKTGLLRLPAEPYAFSNRATARGGPAAWSAAAFELPAAGGSQVLEID